MNYLKHKDFKQQVTEDIRIKEFPFRETLTIFVTLEAHDRL